MAELSFFADIASQDSGLVVVNTLRADGSVQSSVVNAGVMAHPLRDDEVIALVAAGGSLKLRHLRADNRITVVARAGWRWVAAEGTAELIGPDDPNPNVGPEQLRLLLRDVFRAAGGTHDDWDEYDRVMAAERRTVVLATPERVYPKG